MSEVPKVLFILHQERAIYSIGEPIRPKLQIINRTTQNREFGQGFIFNWEDLAFAQPNFVHLIDPDDMELTLPHHRDKHYFKSSDSITVGAGKEEWLYLPIYAHFHLRKPGDYKFWVEILDNLEELHHSNKINFQLVDVESSIPFELIELSLQFGKSSFKVAEHIGLETIFTNRSNKSLIFLKPQDDSLYGWVNPVYQFTVVNSDGRTLALAPRSGTMAIPTYGDDTKFTIAPGKSHRQKLQLPIFPQMQNPGKYRIRLTYIVREKTVGKAGIVLDKAMNWEKEVFIGRIESNELEIMID